MPGKIRFHFVHDPRIPTGEIQGLRHQGQFGDRGSRIGTAFGEAGALIVVHYDNNAAGATAAPDALKRVGGKRALLPPPHSAGAGATVAVTEVAPLGGLEIEAKNAEDIGVRKRLPDLKLATGGWPMPRGTASSGGRAGIHRQCVQHFSQTRRHSCRQILTGEQGLNRHPTCT